MVTRAALAVEKKASIWTSQKIVTPIGVRTGVDPSMAESSLMPTNILVTLSGVRRIDTARLPVVSAKPTPYMTRPAKAAKIMHLAVRRVEKAGLSARLAISARNRATDRITTGIGSMKKSS